MHSELRCLWLAACLGGLLPSLTSAQVTHGPPRIRNVYIPADELQLLFDGSSKGVLMPREKVLALWQEAQRRGPSQTVPPADAVPTQATYEAQLAEHELRITGRIRIAKLADGPQAVDLPFGGLAIESAKLGGQPARFGRKEDGSLFLLLDKAGRFDLELEMSAPLASKGGDLATTLKLPPVPAAEILVRLDKGKQLQLGETTLPSDGTDGGWQLFRVAVGRGGLVPLVISERLAAGSRVPLVLVNSRATGQIEPAGLRWERRTRLGRVRPRRGHFSASVARLGGLGGGRGPGIGSMDDAERGRWHGGRQAHVPQTVYRPPRCPAAGTGAGAFGRRVELPHAEGVGGRVARRTGVALSITVAAR